MYTCSEHVYDGFGPCPFCVATMVLGPPVDLNQHPLAPFFLEVVKEYERGLGKYGDWSAKDNDWQTKAVKSECLEWEAANLKTVDGTKREMQELTHLGNVAGKRWNELNRRK